MAGTPFKSGPAYLASAVADVANVNPAANTYRLVRHIHLANTDTVARTYTLYIGATGGSAGGTEIAKAVSIPASSVADLYFPAGRKFITTDFLSGLASAVSTITIEVMGESYAT